MTPARGGSTSADAFEMAIVHRVFRNELESAPRLIHQCQNGHAQRKSRVADHIANILSALHHHHMAEDDLLWPKLHSRIPLLAEQVRRMEQEHARIAQLTHNVSAALATWAVAAHPGAAYSLIRELTRLAVAVDEHLNDEEEHVVPLINAHISAEEWRETTDRGAAFIGPTNIRFGIAFVGLALAAASPDERRRFLAGMPFPQRAIAKLVGKRITAAYLSTLSARMPGNKRSEL
jgi:iron-sulfur cluster repair protein YtfE (RIC family)